VGRWRANGELAAPVSHAALRVSIAGRKTTVPMVVPPRTAHPSTGCAHRRENFFAASTRPARDLARRILDVRAPARRPTPEERDPRIDLEHNVMAMRRNGTSPFRQENLGWHPEELHRTA